MTAAQYSFPSPAGCSVMSVSHSRSGAVTVNWRRTRSSSVAAFTRLRRPLRRVDALDAGLPHEPLDALAVNFDAQAEAQLGVHSR
jgi:hypothetical protein